MSDGVRNINIDGVLANLAERLYDPVRERYERRFVLQQEEPEAQVLASLSLRQYRLFLSVKCLSEEGLFEESNATMRSASETVVNLMYIMDVGEEWAEEERSPAQLAKMFVGYGDVAYFKLLKNRRGRAAAAFQKNYRWSEDQIEEHYAQCEQKSIEARALGCTAVGWHKMGLSKMAEKVLAHLPDYADDEFAKLVLSDFTSGNSATHGDALSLRSQYKDLGGGPLEVIRKRNQSNTEVAAAFVFWAWRRGSRYFDDEAWFLETKDQTLKKIVLERWEQGSPA